MDENELPHLLTLIGALRAARTEDSIFGTVVQEDSESARAASYSVRARTNDGTYEYEEVGTGHSVAYNPSEASLVVAYGGEAPSRSFGCPHFPMFAPALGMFSPLDLPLWGGDADGNTVTSVRPGQPGYMRVEFGNKDDPFQPGSPGYAVIDLALGVVMEMELQGKRLTTSNGRTLPLLRGFDREFDSWEPFAESIPRVKRQSASPGLEREPGRALRHCVATGLGVASVAGCEPRR